MAFNFKSIISPNQHGFTRGISTVSNSVSFNQYVSEILDMRGQIDKLV